MRDFPRHIELELTNVCNISCIMCPHKIMERLQGFMSCEVFYKAIDEAKGKCKTSYLHQIGEPLLHPHLIEFINYTDRAGISTSISTNCMLLDDTMAEDLLNSSLKEITLCLDSLDPEVYKTIRVGGDFKKVQKNIVHFLKERDEKMSSIHVQIQMIRMKENENEWERFRSIFATTNVEILVKEYSTFGGKVSKGEDVAARRHTCTKMNTHITINWNGDIVPCCRDFNSFEVMGNIESNTIKEVWGSEGYKDFRKNFKTTELCRDC